MNTDLIAEKNIKAKKMMLWFGMISMTMTFAGLTSAYVVSSNRSDWVKQIDLPIAFTISTLLILLSSVTFYIAKRFLTKDTSKALLFLGATLILALAFIYFQFQGFNGIIDQGYYFTGAESSINTSYLYVLVLLHLLHLFGGLIVVSIVIFKTLRGAYQTNNTLGFDLAVTFWHFLDFLWLYLFLFVSFYR